MYKLKKYKSNKKHSRFPSIRRAIVLPFLFLVLVLSGALLYIVATDDSVNNQHVSIANENKDDSEGTESDKDEQSLKDTQDDDKNASDDPQQKPNKQQDEEDNSGLLSLLVLVNKRNQIQPLAYSPPNLTSPSVIKRSGATLDARAASALESMFQAAKDEGITLMLSNGFRSYATQQSLYNSYVQQDGQANADTYSARPGHSEHQTGLAADIIVPSGTCSLEQCFGDLPEGKWLAQNAHNYGFIIRYTKTNKSEAGYTHEPWHIRYIGVSDAKQYYTNNASSLESYLGKPAAPDYL